MVRKGMADEHGVYAPHARVGRQRGDAPVGSGEHALLDGEEGVVLRLRGGVQPGVDELRAGGEGKAGSSSVSEKERRSREKAGLYTHQIKQPAFALSARQLHKPGRIPIQTPELRVWWHGVSSLLGIVSVMPTDGVAVQLEV